MTESMLHGLMRLFAILASIRKENSEILSVNFVESFLKIQFSKNLVDRSLVIFNEYLEDLGKQESRSKEKRISLLSVKILTICDQINREMHVRNKYFILITLIQFSRYFDDHSASDNQFRHTITDAVKTIANGLLLDSQDFENCLAFITGKFYKVPGRSEVLVINDEKSVSFSNINHLQRTGLKGNIYLLHIRQAGLYIFYFDGDLALSMGGKTLYSNHIYIFPKASSIKFPGMEPVYYSDVVSSLLRKTGPEKIILQAREISYQYPGSDNGIKALSFRIESCTLMGIMGGSGTGKSTLIKMLTGSLPLQGGDILINGKSIASDTATLKAMIGYIPQEDLLIEELTVFENLYYSASLSLGHLNEKEIKKLVLKTLNTLDLLYIRDLKVGSTLNKFISGGQRKRLNIALELIREPYILFADEPTSGLSSTDSEKVLQLLKQQVLSGKIVIINIHQPSSDLYKMLDTLLILDKGGYPVYFGNPMEAFTHLKNAVERIDASEIECSHCGNVQTDELLQVIESNLVDPFGEFTGERKMAPSDWYKLFREKFSVSEGLKNLPPGLPVIDRKVPTILRQFKIYSIRNFLTRMADHQYLVFAGLIGPVLALILGFFTKYVQGSNENPHEYIFSQNSNLPAYIFMTVIVALFIGLIISAEEIIRDRRILARESFLDLSWWSYLNSKILFLFGLTAFQMLVFVLIGNFILEIKGMNLQYFIVLFSTAAFAVMLGLNISSAFKSVIAIYINIPFILIPLILLSGVIVKYDKLHYKVGSAEYVPVVGDLMASRWAYEALTVNQFRNNLYERYFFDVEKNTARVKYQLNYFLPEVRNLLSDLENADGKPETDLRLTVENSLQNNRVINPSGRKTGAGNRKEIADLQKWLDLKKDSLVKLNFALIRQKDMLIERLVRESGMDLPELKARNYNESLAELVLNSNEMKKIQRQGNRLIRKDSPVFHDPVSEWGRAHFYAPSHRIGNYLMDTFIFDVIVLWMMSLFLYLSLVFKWFSKVQKNINRFLNRKKF